MAPRPGMWHSRCIGGGAPPFRVEQGWLELYHGVNETARYWLGAVLLDAAHPEHVLGRLSEPFLMPEAPFEREGFFGNVVFTCGTAPLDDGSVRVYYGAADRVTGDCDVDVAALLSSLEWRSEAASVPPRCARAVGHHHASGVDNARRRCILP